MTASSAAANDAASRHDALRVWVSRELGVADVSLTPASSDASFRRYFRVETPQGTYIIMDAPPPQEDCQPFVKVAALFSQADVHVPAIHAQDLQRGFLVLSDLGATTYLDRLQAHARDAADHREQSVDPDALYRDAIQALVKIQQASRAGVLPEYDRVLLERELRLFPDWYMKEQLGVPVDAQQAASLQSAFEVILANNLAQPRVYVHRDFHSRNLMVCEPNPGVLDFQDAVHGPLSYDLVSLLRDAYIEWEEERVIDWCVRFWELARRVQLPVNTDFAEFYRDFEWMGVQRHLKVVGIFARLAYRDGKRAYLNDQPLVLRYLKKASRRYRELQGLARLLDELAPEVIVNP